MEKTKKILVRCTIYVPVEVPDNPDYDMYFDIEDNHCPGTGLVGAALENLIEESNKNSTCWACPHGKNEIVNSV